MKVRVLTDADRANITRMIALDVDHSAKQMTADFFYPDPADCRFALCFCDNDGPVFYVRFDIERDDTVRVHIQFDESTPLRTVRTFTEGFAVVKSRCQLAEARRMVFDSMNAGLRQFCIRRFGFQPVPGTADLELIIEN